MRLSDVQAHMLFITLKDTLGISGSGIFSYSNEDRHSLLNQILKQQDDTVVDLGRTQAEENEALEDDDDDELEEEGDAEDHTPGGSHWPLKDEPKPQRPQRKKRTD